MRTAGLRAVTLDLGGTLLKVDPSVGEVYSAGAARYGYEVTADEIEQNFRRGWAASLARSAGRGYRTSDAILREEWRQIVADSFAGCVPEDALGALFEDLYAHFAAGRAWVVAPGVRTFLEQLRSHGLRLGLLSNWDSRVDSTLAGVGLSGAFDAVTVSHAVGFEKPHPEIFRRALAQLGTTPQETLHVGDSLTADIEPARELGLHTLWISAEDRAEGGPRVESFLDIDAHSWASIFVD